MTARLPQGGRFAACDAGLILAEVSVKFVVNREATSMIRSAGIVLLVAAYLAEPAAAQSYSASKLEMPAPDAVSPEVAAQLQPAGIKVSKGSSTFCEIWLAKEWPVAED